HTQARQPSGSKDRERQARRHRKGELMRIKFPQGFRQGALVENPLAPGKRVTVGAGGINDVDDDLGAALVKKYGVQQYKGPLEETPEHIKTIEELQAEIDRQKQVGEIHEAGERLAADATRLSKRKVAQETGVIDRKGRSKSKG